LTIRASTAPPFGRGLIERIRGNPQQALLMTSVWASSAVLTVVAAATIDLSGHAVAGGLVLLAAATLAEAFPVPVGGGRASNTSLATIFIVAAAALYSWQTAVLVALVAILVVELKAGRALVRWTFNVGLYVLSAAAAGGALGLVGLLTNVDRAAGSVVASTAFYVADLGLLASIIASSQRVQLPSVLRDLVESTFAPFVTMTSTTPLLVFVWEQAPFASAALGPPLIAIVLYQRRLHASLERQRELDRLKDEFVAVVSHELRTPLASVYGGVETLQRDDLTPEHRAALHAVVRTEAARLARLVDDVLWVSRLETPAQRPVTGRCDTRTVIDEVVDAARATAPASVSIAAVHADEPDAAVDADALRRVLSNLVENAVKYSPAGGEITVSAARDDGALSIAISDEGMGIPDDQYETIFEKFSRLDPQMGGGIGGTGLGLYICRELVDQMAGSISVAANPAGRGSVFTVRVPAASPSD
jgi:signal transduction histidine kinase